MKKYFTVLLLVTFLFSCSQTNDTQNIVEQEVKKTPFYIETKELWEFSSEVLFKKSAKLVSTSQLDVTSQASWKVSKINFQVWDKVTSWENLVILDDNISNYYTSLERGKNTLEKAKINYDSTLLGLDKTISDLQINYDKALKNHELLLLDSQEKLQKAEIDYSESKVDSQDSKTQLDLSKLEQDLQKAKLDYDNWILNDTNQLNSYIENIKSNYKSLSLTYFDVMNYLDEFFWVTDKNRYKNEAFEIYISAKNISLKTQVETELKKVIFEYDAFKNKDLSWLNEANIQEYLNNLDTTYAKLRDILNLSKEAIKNSVENSDFSQWTIDMYFNTVTNYWNGVASSYNQFVSLKTNTTSFLNTYKQNQSSRLEAVNILQKQIDISYKQAQINETTFKSGLSRTQIDINNNIVNSEIWLKSAKNNLDNAIKNKEITLRSLKNSIKEAEIALSESQKNAGKLVVKAPISWVISKKSVDLWQEVSAGSKLFTIVWDNMTKVEIYLSSDEKTLVSVWDNVKVNYFNNELSGKIESISPVASSDFTYLTTISISDKVDIIWDFVEVSFLTKSESILLPVSILKIIWNNTALVNVYDNGKIVPKEIKIWQIFNNEIEVISWLSQEYEVVLTDLKNYNENDFEVIKK